MEYVVVFRPEVQGELTTAYRWYESKRVGLGRDFMERVDEQVNRLTQNPKLYPVVYRDVRRAVLRRFPYAIYYRIVSSRVIVTAVFHGRRDPGEWQRRN